MEAHTYGFYDTPDAPADAFKFVVAQDTLARAVEDKFAEIEEADAFAICAYGYAGSVPEDWPFVLTAENIENGFVEVDFYTGGIDAKCVRYFVHEIREVE